MIHAMFYDFHSRDATVICMYDVAKQLTCLQVYVASFCLIMIYHTFYKQCSSFNNSYYVVRLLVMVSNSFF